MRTRLLLIGLDSATLRLVRPWAQRGDLPALGQLMHAGTSGVLQSVPNMITPAAWTSFATGANPGRHGIFYFTERVPGTYQERPVKGGTRALPPFWMLLSEAGVPCTVVSVPMTYPADPLAGVMVSGMDAPSAAAPGFTHPPELARELIARFGDLIGKGSLSGAIGHLMLAGRVEEACAVLEQRVRVRTDLARYLMDRYPTDLFALVHTEVDGAQHYFWRYLAAETARPGTDAILRLYRAVDRSLEELMQSFGPSNVMIVSDHGAGPSPGVEDGVPWIRLVLEEQGLAVRRRESNPWRRTTKRALAAAYHRFNPRLPQTARRLLTRWAPAVKSMARASVKHEYDWTQTRAFCMGASGEIWLNVAGRDPQGSVTPGQEYEQLRRQLRDIFLSLRDERTGEAIIEAVYFRDEVYTGPFVDRAADLFVLFKDVSVRGLKLDGKTLRLPHRAASRPKEIKTGSHRPDGVVILAGEGIRPGADLTGARLVDVAPTVLYWMGQPVPTSMDGAVLIQAFSEAHLASHPIDVVGRAGEPEVRADTPYTPEEEDVVMERLRGLGYV